MFTFWKFSTTKKNLTTKNKTNCLNLFVYIHSTHENLLEICMWDNYETYINKYTKW